MPEFLQFTLQIAVKALYTGVLGALIFVLGSEAWRVWFDHALVLSPFSYLRDGAESRESGLSFTQLVNHDLRRLRDLYAPSSAAGNAIPSTDQVGGGFELAIPSVAHDALSDFEIDAYGVPVTQLLKRVSRWIRPPNEIVGNVSERAGRLDLYAEVRGARKATPWSVLRSADVNELSAALACRILRHLAEESNPRLFGDGHESNRVNEREFCLFIDALDHYQLYTEQVRDSKEDAMPALDNAAKVVDKLLDGEPRFAFTHKLAAYVLRERGNAHGALQQLDLYDAALRRAGLSDEKANEVRSALRTRIAEALPSDRATAPAQVRPLRPGISLSGVDGGAGTLACVVEDAAGNRYAITVDHVLSGTAGEVAIQPGKYDGGTLASRIGVVARVIAPRSNAPNRVAAALIRLDPGVESSNDVVGIGQIRGVAPATVALIGTPFTMVGRSGVVKGTITQISASLQLAVGGHAVTFEDMIATTRVSQPGDSGAPILTEDHLLIGFVFAGSENTTIVMPAQPVLDALGVELAPGVVATNAKPTDS